MSQLLGFVYAFFLIISSFGKSKQMILLLQTISFLFKGIHYLLLGGVSGFLTSIVSMIRNLIFYKINVSKVFTTIFIIIYLIIGIYTYSSFYSMLPVVATIIYTLVINKENIIYLKGGMIITSISWLIYNVYIISYSGIIIQAFILVSNVYALIYDKNEKN